MGDFGRHGRLGNCRRDFVIYYNMVDNKTILCIIVSEVSLLFS